MNSLNVEGFGRLAADTQPYAVAFLEGSAAAPELQGMVRFYPAARGSLVVAEVFALPSAVEKDGKTQQAGPFYAFHIHEGAQCGSGEGDEPFPGSGGHWNPEKKPHPMHQGDLPPLFSDSGYAYAAVYSDRFTPKQAVGHTIIVHQAADDFHTQPSGNAGMKLACGTIVRVKR